MGKYIVLQHPSRRSFRPLIDAVFGRKYVYLTVDLWRTPYQLSAKGLKRIDSFISGYMFAKKIYGKTFGCSRDIVSLYVLKEDLDEVLSKLLKMVRRYSQPIRRLGGGGGSGGR
jgi:hypothetical protein